MSVIDRLVNIDLTDKTSSVEESKQSKKNYVSKRNEKAADTQV